MKTRLHRLAVATLEREAIDKFVASFNELLELIAEKQHAIADAA